MRTQESTVTKNVWTVSVDPGELITDSGKPYPFATTIGTIEKKKNGKAKITVWMPASYTPRGYKSAAKRALEKEARGLGLSV